MFNEKHYVPLLKGRDGDFWSLRNLKPGSRPWITPLLESVPPSAKQTEAARITATIRKIGLSWADTFFSDLVWRDGVLLPGGVHVVTEFFNQARAANLPSIPVTGLGRSPSYQIATRDVVALDNRGLAIRLIADDFTDTATLVTALRRLVDFMRLTPAEVDIIVDLKSVELLAVGLITTTSRSCIAALPNINDWRTLTVGATSFPASLARLPQATWSNVNRKEWLSWKQVIASTGLPRMPSYADYGVRDPDLPYTGFARYAVNLRYSAADDFFIWRGYQASRHPLGNGQIHGICADLVPRPQYAGAAFSQGDSEIQTRATSVGSPGGPNTWLQWATNHYLELVVSQIASLP